MRYANIDQTHPTVLDGFMRKVLVGVDVFCAFSTSDHVVSPFDARCVVLTIVHLSVWVLGNLKAHVLEDVAEVNNLNGHLGCCIVCSASALDNEMVFCCFDLHCTMHLLYLSP